MCYHTIINKSPDELQSRFNANFDTGVPFLPGIFNAFQHPQTPIITNQHPDTIQLFSWGLVPHWAKDTSIQKNTLNARIETLHEKPSFKYILSNRCLIIADGFYEWQWLDNKGKQKQKYMLTLPDNELFALAGLWNVWQDKTSNQQLHTYTIITTAANELMSKIHNTKKRMPVIVSKEHETDWLSGKELIMQNESLVAVKV